MAEFLGENFLLKSQTAIAIYNSVKNLPIIDYHCHLNPGEIAENKRFQNITEMWLSKDHYKWRLMRANGVSEKYITGDATDYEKFLKWAETIEEAIGNPLYHWSHLELKRCFGYEGLLNRNTADQVWEHCNKIISQDDFTVKNLIEKFSVETVCTTDDPVDSLEFHKCIKEDKNFKAKVYPTFRPSTVINIESEKFLGYIEELSKITSIEIDGYSSLLDALYSRVDYFNQHGCRLSDHSLEPVIYTEYAAEEINEIVSLALQGKQLSKEQTEKYKTAIFHDLCLKYHEVGWVVQMHIGCLRNTNSKMYEMLGLDAGFDCMDDKLIAGALVKTLDSLNVKSKLAKTILYCLNPINDDLLATITGSFQGDGIKGKIQFGSAWWFNDNKSGMEKQMVALANNGMLARFVGMLTDSRSFLSYTRHEYFRRILCNLIAEWVEAGEFPNDMSLLVNIASNICYYNAKQYFNF